MPTETMPATDVARRLVDAVNARLDTVHHEWEPGSVLAAAVLDELDVLLDRHDQPVLNRDFLQHVRQAVCGGNPYCNCCGKCGSPSVGRCDCPITVPLTNGTTTTV